MLTLGPNLGLLVNGDQGEEHYNELMAQFRGLDALVQCRALSATTTAQPGSPTDGDVYVVPSGATGAAWAGQDGKLARYSGVVPGWEFFTPQHGWRVYVGDADRLVVYTGALWTTVWEYNPLERRFKGSVGTSDDTPATIMTIPLDVSTQCVMIEANVLGKGGAPDLTTFRLVASFKNTAGTISQVGATTEVHKVADGALSAAVVDFAIAGTDVLVQVTGIAATSITWTGRAVAMDN